MSNMEKDKNEFREYTDKNILLTNPVPNSSTDNDNFSSVRKFLNEAKKPNIARSDSIHNKAGSEATYETDIRSMSLASMYENGRSLSNDMDTTRDAGMSPRPGRSGTSLTETIEILSPDGNNSNPFVGGINPSLYFNDGIRSIDFVLVWVDFEASKANKTDIVIETPTKQLEKAKDAKLKREVFEENLVREGLELERETVGNNEFHFIKIHTPVEVLRRYSEILKLRMPMRESLCGVEQNNSGGPIFSTTRYLSEKIPGLKEVKTKTNSIWEKICSRFLVDEKKFPKKSHRFTAVYSRDKEYLFDLDQDDFFSAGIRSRIVQFILDRKRFSRDKTDDFAFGIDRLISTGAYQAAYPIHDGDLHMKGSVRNLLYIEWASVRKCLHYQPLDYVKDYFGVKIGLYFAWLGFYTHMLIPAAIVGVICFAYSWFSIDNNAVCQDICSNRGDIDMCPLCDYWCDYWKLKETCFHAKVTVLFDNSTTVFFAVFMSFWATLFLELWKRYSAEITHRWDLTGFDIQEEHPRPKYLARLAHVERRIKNIVTNTWEPHVPFWKVKLPATILSFSVVLLLIAMAVAAVLALVLYRMSVLAALSVYGDNVITSYAILFTTATAASINLCLIVLFNMLYTWLAEYLTEVELLRTQTEFDDSLTLKIYLLQFVNYYASIFYIAFFKGKFVGYPGNYNRLFNYRQEECGLGGCLMELCIQLSIIMVGKQAINTVLEMLLPLLYKWWNVLKMIGRKASKNNIRGSAMRWVKDFKLVEWGSRGLFPEYLEMVLQYGFVTIFVAAFPLAPFFALLNNILEMRLDAKKLLTFYRRPVSQRVRDIGVWYRILDSIGKLAVITNGFIIAFTSNFIPKLVYQLTKSPDGSLEGFLDFSLAKFNTTEFKYPKQGNVTECRYPDFREPPTSSNRYNLTLDYWHILAARLAFVVVFENVVALVMIFVRWVIPDIPQHLRDQIRREAYITNEIIIKQEAARARGKECVQMDNAVSQHWAVLLDRTLSGSQLDLEISRQQDFQNTGNGSINENMRMTARHDLKNGEDIEEEP